MLDDHDHGDEDRRPIFRDWLELFAWTADNGKRFPALVPMLVAEYEEWRTASKAAQ